jgi:hypothetical protein
MRESFERQPGNKAPGIDGANIYLRYVVDLWFEKRYAKSCSGKAYLVRYADDFVACFEDQQDAKRFVDNLYMVCTIVVSAHHRGRYPRR